jgi:hypothetical protein
MFLVVSSLGMLAGIQLHESAHYLVLKVAGRSPTMVLPSIADGRILARVRFDGPEDHIPMDVRLAAVAPLLAALVFALPLFFVGLLLGYFGLLGSFSVLIGLGRLTKHDIRFATA